MSLKSPVLRGECTGGTWRDLGIGDAVSDTQISVEQWEWAMAWLEKREDVTPDVRETV